MLTEFGRYLRKFRIDCGELLKDMADKLGVTPSYLSAIETGKRNIPENWVEKIAGLYHLDLIEKDQLADAAANSVKSVTMDLERMAAPRREAALLFARKFEQADDSTIMTIRDLLKKQLGDF
jgi:transcriptional regulator with XRE-family HTH domain